MQLQYFLLFLVCFQNCHALESKTSKTITVKGDSSCPYTDKDKNCADYKDPHCTSGKWLSWMMKNCAKTCKCTGIEGCSPLPNIHKGDYCSKHLRACKVPQLLWFRKECSKTCNYCDATKPKCACGVKKKGTRIVGGSVTEVNEYPWMARLKIFSDEPPRYCGGSLIADRWILSAAHCFFDFLQGKKITDPSMIRIILGEHDTRTTDETNLTREITPDLIIHHSAYEFKPVKCGIFFFSSCRCGPNRPEFCNHNSEKKHDITLLRLPSPVNLTIYTPICLPPTGAHYVGKRAWAYGWGNIQLEGPVSEKLRDVELTVVSDDAAKKAFRRSGRSLTEDQLDVMIFAGEEGKHSARGDSGGPLSYSNNGVHEQIGVVSWGTPRVLFKAFAEVPVFRPWIDEQIANNGGADFCTA